MSTIDILYKGQSIVDDVEFSTATFMSKADGNVGTCSFRIKDIDHVYNDDFLHSGGELELWIDGERAWDGWVIDVSQVWAFPVDNTETPAKTPRYWQVSGYDRNVLFTKRIQFDQENPANTAGFKMWPAGTYDQEAIEYALTHYVDLTGDGLELAISGIDMIDEDAEFKIGGVSQPMLTIFTDAQKMTGGVFYISPGRVLRYRDSLNENGILTDQPQWYGEEEQEYIYPYRNVKIKTSILEAATRALVWGAGRGSDDPVFAKYDVDPENYGEWYDIGLWEWGDLFVNAYKYGTVLKRARTYVDGSPSHRVGHGFPMPFVTCDVFKTGIRAGDGMWFENYVYGYSRTLPVRSVEMTFPTKTSVLSQLELTLTVDAPWSAYDLWEDPDEAQSEKINFGVDPVYMYCEWEYLDTFNGRTLVSEYDIGVANNAYSETRTWYNPYGGGGG